MKEIDKLFVWFIWACKQLNVNIDNKLLKSRKLEIKAKYNENDRAKQKSKDIGKTLHKSTISELTA